MTRTFRQIIGTQKVQVLDVESDIFIEANLINYKPDVITVLFPDNSEVELYLSIDISNLYQGYFQGKEYACKL